MTSLTRLYIEAPTALTFDDDELDGLNVDGQSYFAGQASNPLEAILAGAASILAQHARQAARSHSRTIEPTIAEPVRRRAMATEPTMLEPTMLDVA